MNMIKNKFKLFWQKQKLLLLIYTKLHFKSLQKFISHNYVFLKLFIKINVNFDFINFINIFIDFDYQKLKKLKFFV